MRERLHSFLRAQPIWLCAAAVLLTLMTIPAGCASDPTKGYAAKSTFPDDVATVNVPIFKNDTFHRDLEFQLTDALVKEIETTTPYQVASSGAADTMMSGTIRDVELDQLSKSRQTGLSEEVIVSVTVDFEWTDLRTDEPLVQRRSFTGHGLFTPSNPSGEPIEIGRFAAVEQLARDIVSEMQAKW